MEMTNNMDDLMREIKGSINNQKTQSMADQIRVQQTLLNDPDYKVGIWDRRKGKVGERCPREEAVKFISDIATNLTGLDKKAADEVAAKYQFTKKDAMFFLNMNHDFTQTYLQTGRKLNIVQTADSEASVFYRASATREKLVPGKNGSITTTVPAFQKLVCKSRCPKYLKEKV
jgi:hypothetical protein